MKSVGNIRSQERAQKTYCRGTIKSLKSMDRLQFYERTVAHQINKLAKSGSFASAIRADHGCV